MEVFDWCKWDLLGSGRDCSLVVYAGRLEVGIELGDSFTLCTVDEANRFPNVWRLNVMMVLESDSTRYRS